MLLKGIFQRFAKGSANGPIVPGIFDRKKQLWIPAPVTPQASLPFATLSLATYNVWFGQYHFPERADALLQILEANATDIIALQEVTPEFLEAILRCQWVRDAYSVSDIAGASITPYGVLLLSRPPVTEWNILLLPTRMFRHLLTATLFVNGTRTIIGAVHLESTKYDGATREEQLGVIFPVLDKFPHAFLMGDFNFCAIRGVENRMLDPRYQDAWEMLHPDAPGYTEDTERNAMRLFQTRKSKQARFDRILVSSNRPGWRAEESILLGTGPIHPSLPNVFPSDHFGVRSRFSWGPPRKAQSSTSSP